MESSSHDILVVVVYVACTLNKICMKDTQMCAVYMQYNENNRQVL